MLENNKTVETRFKINIKESYFGCLITKIEDHQIFWFTEPVLLWSSQRHYLYDQSILCRHKKLFHDSFIKPERLKLLRRFRLGLSHLRDHKFKHNFLDTINPLCSCGSNSKMTSHFFFYCPIFLEKRLPFSAKFLVLIVTY